MHNEVRERGALDVCRVKVKLVTLTHTIRLVQLSQRQNIMDHIVDEVKGTSDGLAELSFQA